MRGVTYGPLDGTPCPPLHVGLFCVCVCHAPNLGAGGGAESAQPGGWRRAAGSRAGLSGLLQGRGDSCHVRRSMWKSSYVERCAPMLRPYVAYRAGPKGVTSFGRDQTSFADSHSSFAAVELFRPDR
eukprot:717594-Prymnesium_polylepis.1